ncbi:MAG: hypothetical protein RLZZ156_891, partial [Deinococcota bacterium]
MRLLEALEQAIAQLKTAQVSSPVFDAQ